MDIGRKTEYWPRANQEKKCLDKSLEPTMRMTILVGDLSEIGEGAPG
jgi:hypothetical protein